MYMVSKDNLRRCQQKSRENFSLWRKFVIVLKVNRDSFGLQFMTVKSYFLDLKNIIMYHLRVRTSTEGILAFL